MLSAALCSGCALLPSNLADGLPGIPGMGGSHPGCGTVCEECGEEVCDEGSPGYCRACVAKMHFGPDGATNAACESTGSLTSLPREWFGNLANFCVPAAAIGPAEIPPPGRFHPVPTVPVFAPLPQ